MELKLLRNFSSGFAYWLLIVPYGIETAYHANDRFCKGDLLIVPYGIETIVFDIRIFWGLALLIVPYGIETWEDAAPWTYNLDF